MNKAFTLVELIIVIGIIALTLPVLFSLFFINLRAQAQIYNLQQVKNNGDAALNTMEGLLRNNAEQIVDSSQVPYCTDPNAPEIDLGSSINLIDHNGKSFGFTLLSNSGRIASTSATTTTTLTNSKVVIVNLDFKCILSNKFSTPLVSVSFDVTRPVLSTFEFANTLHYQTKIKLRN